MSIFLLLLVLFQIYLHFLCPTIYGGDSAELITAGYILGVPHAPGYPVYCLLAKLFSNIIIFGNHAFRINCLSAVISCANTALIYFAAKNIIKGRFAAFLAAVIFAFLPLTFEQAVVAEVFGLNLLFFLLILFVLTCDFFVKNNELFLPKYYLAGFIFGLGMGNHHMLSLALPGLALFVYFELGASRLLKLIKRPAFYIFSFFGLSVYLYLFIRAQADPSINFGDPDTLKRLWAIFTRQEFGSFELHPSALKGRSLDSLTGQMIVYVSTLLKELGFFGLFMAAAGFVFSRKYKVYLPLLTIFALASPFFIFYSNLSPNALANWRLERFYLLPLSVICIFLGIAFCRLEEFALKRHIKQVSTRILLVVPVIFIIFSNSRISGTRTNFYFHDFAANIVKGVEKRGLLMFDQLLFDEYGSGVAYLTDVLSKRRDMQVIARSGTMFNNVYGDDFFDLDGVGRKNKRRSVERLFLDRQENRFFIAVMDKNKADVNSELYCDGLIYKSSEKPGPPWFAYVRRELMPGRDYPEDYPTRLVLAHYPYFKGKCSLGSKEYIAADRSFMECSEYGYDFEWLMFNIGSVYSRRGDLKKAGEYYEKALFLDPFFPDTYFGLGYVYLKKGKIETAEGFLEKCVDLDPNYSQAYYNLGFVKYKLGKRSEAKANFDKYFSYVPDSQLKESIKKLGL